MKPKPLQNDVCGKIHQKSLHITWKLESSGSKCARKCPTPSAEAEPPNPRYKVAWPRYTAEKKNNLGWTTLYPLPSRECLYKVAWSGYTLGETPIDVGWTRSRAENAIKWPAPLKTSIDVCWAMLGRFIHFQPLPSLRNSKRCCPNRCC